MKQTFLEFCRVLKLRSKLSCSCFEFWAFGASFLRVCSSSEASKQAFFEFSRVKRLRTWLCLNYLARAVVILNALAVMVGRSQTFSIQASFETGNPPERVPIRSQNGAATPAGGPVEMSWSWGCPRTLRERQMTEERQEREKLQIYTKQRKRQ